MALDIVKIDSAGLEPGHPWVDASRLTGLPESVTEARTLSLMGSDGVHLGCGIYDPEDACAAWRRYSRAEDVLFDEAYITGALVEALERRSDESCQRLVSSDADFLPGVVAELFDDLLWVSLETKAARGHAEAIAEVLQDIVNPVEIVLEQGQGPQTFSGQGLKGRWIEVDELLYRIDLLNPQKPRFFLDQREQHPLVGSLCEGRAVLDLFSHNGAFALHAARAGAARVVSVDREENYVKAIGANAQRNELHVETVSGDAMGYLAEVEPGEFDAIILDPPAAYDHSSEQVTRMHLKALANLSPGGLLATYCRGADWAGFEALVARAASDAGREARIFARTSQPFDFPMLLNFPQSQTLRGLILQVE